MSQSIPPSSENSDLSIAIAIRAAIITSSIVFVFVFLGRFGFLPFQWNWFLKMVFQTIVVAVVSWWIIQRYARKNPEFSLSEHALISTFFFYGTSLIFTYIAKIATIAIEFFFFQSRHISGAFAFVVGVENFSTAAIVQSALFSILPYAVYYFTIRSARMKMP